MKTVVELNAEMPLAVQAYAAACVEATTKDRAYRAEHGHGPQPDGFQVSRLPRAHPAAVRLATLEQELATAGLAAETQPEATAVSAITPELQAIVDASLAKIWAAQAAPPAPAAPPPPVMTALDEAEAYVASIVGPEAYTRPASYGGLPMPQSAPDNEPYDFDAAERLIAAICGSDYAPPAADSGQPAVPAVAPVIDPEAEALVARIVASDKPGIVWTDSETDRLARRISEA